MNSKASLISFTNSANNIICFKKPIIMYMIKRKFIPIVQPLHKPRELVSKVVHVAGFECE